MRVVQRVRQTKEIRPALLIRLQQSPQPIVPRLACTSITACNRSSVVASRIIQWVSEALSRKIAGRDERWSEAIAVGDFTFVHKVKSLGFKAMHRRVMEDNGTFTLREESEPYSAIFTIESEALRPENTLLWDEHAEIT
jgi:hypothetical protein